MKTFAELTVQHDALFPGKKIGIEYILDQKIVVLDWKVRDSKFKDGSGKCLHLSLEFQGEKRVLFSGSMILADILAKLPKEDFPFETTIKRQYRALKFT